MTYHSAAFLMFINTVNLNFDLMAWVSWVWLVVKHRNFEDEIDVAFVTPQNPFLSWIRGRHIRMQHVFTSRTVLFLSQTDMCVLVGSMTCELCTFLTKNARNTVK